ncbi:asparagine synthetase B family protein [Streptomyces maremycinicus]|uniref:asparagine synthetase B family protein n=1 Tax=Streptomyces maremycinicus TaxID=1679753 RepID=UPI00078748E4|nr:asparagine synthase-related protein [Streptomyces sp. NBRC 110468]
MGAITGWTDPARDVREADATVAQLIAYLTPRARGAASLWSDREAMLAHRADPTSSEGTGLAEFREDDRTIAVAVLDGYLQNTEDLAGALGAERGAGPADVLLRGYLAWGTAVAERLEGNFAFAVWDARARRLVLGRDRIGITPLHYARADDGTLFSSDLAAMVAHPLLRAEMDAEGLCAAITQIRPPGRSALRGVREVPAGCVVVLSGAHEEVRRYWTLEARPHEDDLDATLARVRELVEDAVTRDLRGIHPAILLSGGLDSSALTGWATRLTARSPRTFTVAFGDGAAAVPDRPYSQAVARMWDTEHREVLVRPQELSDPVVLAAVLAAKDYPCPFGDKNITPYLFSRRVAEHTAVALSGEAADTVFGSLGGRIKDGYELSTFPWVEKAWKWGARSGLGTGLFDPKLLAEIGSEAYLALRFREALDEVPCLPSDPQLNRLGRQYDYLTVTRMLDQAINHSERLAAAAGLQLRYPFSDHRLFSYLYNVPVEMKWYDGRGKSLLRTLARDLVPESVLSRPKVPYPITYASRYKAALAARLRGLLDDSDAPVRPLLDIAAARRIAADPDLLDRGGWFGRADVEFALNLDAWLRRLRVHLRL